MAATQPTVARLVYRSTVGREPCQGGTARSAENRFRTRRRTPQTRAKVPQVGQDAQQLGRQAQDQVGNMAGQVKDTVQVKESPNLVRRALPPAMVFSAKVRLVTVVNGPTFAV
jgi:hypothetical protein